MADETPLGDATRRAALDAYARNRGHNTWREFCGTAGITPATRGLFDTITAAIAPLQAEIQRLTAGVDPACEPTARELVDTWNGLTDDERLNLAARMIAARRDAERCILGRCQTGDDLLTKFPELANARVRFWCCPAHDKGTVEWRDDVAHCTTDDCDITSATLRTPAEWSVLDRVIIHGADGWRGRDAKPFTEPITHTEFLRRMSISSIERRKPFPSSRGEVPGA